MNKKILIGGTFIIVIAIVIASIYFLVNSSKTPAQFVGKYITAANGLLAANVDLYMEKENNGMFCAHTQYGYDDKYVYTWMFCEGFEVKSSGAIVATTGFSVPTRFEYDNKTMEVFNFKQPGDGSEFDATVKLIFPSEITVFKSVSDETTTYLESRVKSKFYKKTDPNLAMKLQLATIKYPAYKNWERQSSFAGKSVAYKKQHDSYFFALITNGTGIAIMDAKCLEVTKLNTVNEIPKSKYGIETKAVDPITCKGLNEE